MPAPRRAVVKYVRSLHANAISITFPFFMNGPHGSGRDRALSQRRRRAKWRVMARIAEAQGLYVVFRPLLDETSIDREFRGNMHPSHPAEWFASYRRFLLPYAKVAQRAKVQEFVVGTELSTLYKSPRWYPLDAAIRRVYYGTLAFDSNWYGVSSLQGAGGKGLNEGVDAYPAIPADIEEGWKTLRPQAAPGTVEMELGIAAVKGAYRRAIQAHVAGETYRPAGAGPLVRCGLPRGGCRASGRDLLLVDWAWSHVPGSDIHPSRSTGVAASRWKGDLRMLRLAGPEGVTVTAATDAPGVGQPVNADRAIVGTTAMSSTGGNAGGAGHSLGTPRSP